MSSLEDWEKKLIKSENLEQKELETYLSGITRHCTLSTDGFVLINPDFDKSLTNKDKVHLILSARFIAHELQTALGRDSPISETVDSQELARMLLLDKGIVQARVSDLKKERKVTDVSKGVYKATLQGIKPLLENLQAGGK